MMEKAIFISYLLSLILICYSVFRQASILSYSNNGARFTQKSFLLFNICFALWCIGQLLQLVGFDLFAYEIVRACLIFIMASVGFVFYSQSK